jgi:hypothetical protein
MRLLNGSLSLSWEEMGKEFVEMHYYASLFF